MNHWDLTRQVFMWPEHVNVRLHLKAILENILAVVWLDTKNLSTVSAVVNRVFYPQHCLSQAYRSSLIYMREVFCTLGMKEHMNYVCMYVFSIITLLLSKTRT